MLVQKMIAILGRLIFYMLLIPLLVGVIYTLSNDQWLAALILMILSALVLYKGLIRLKIPANSLVVRDGKVVFFIPEKTVRDRFDFASRGQTIIQMPHFGLLDRPYKLEIIVPDSTGGLGSCQLSLNLGYSLELPALQRAYDNFVLYQDQLSLVVKRQLFKSSADMPLPAPLPNNEDAAEYLKPLVAELDLGLENLGLKIETAACKFTSGQRLVRFVAVEQEIVEKSV
ncbi:MAG: hypothetical protein FIA91_08715 [Geobacter sp.]|nr:hypothetical protein [Geobacter sp.]